MSLRISLFTLVYIVFLSTAIWAQGLSRSGYPSPMENINLLRQFPCGGITILDENVDQMELPLGWTRADLDGGTPNTNIQFFFPNGGWQVTKDPKDTTNGNFVFASPSWYQGKQVSDDWLISPQITNLPADVCLSWYAYSADEFFPEDYEIWVSTGGNSPQDFINGNNKEFEVIGEGIEFTFRSLSLERFVGRDIYIAFRHKSDDKFALVLDQIRVAEVGVRDLAIFSLDEIRAKPNDEIFIAGSFINRSLDTVRYDTFTPLEIYYSIDDQDSNRYEYPGAFVIGPNDTLNFVHDSLWVPTESRVYRVKVWLEKTIGDSNPLNDTVGFWQGIGTATNVDPDLESDIRVFPNPAKDRLFVELPLVRQNWQAVLFDQMGREVLHSDPQQGKSLDMKLDGLEKGLYILQIRDDSSIMKTQKLLVD